MAAGTRYAFDTFELDSHSRRLTRDGQSVPLSDRHVDVLLQLVSHPADVLSKDALVEAAWHDVAVTDNSLEQAISALRRALGRPDMIETVPRRGYRFTAAVTRTVARESDEALDALLAPHRAWIEGRAALETLERAHILRAREAFERAVANAPDQSVGHVGLANACVMQFEMTRADPAPDVAGLSKAALHAREACRLDPQSGEAWATLGFVLDRTGNHLDAIAASRRAVTLEPDNWRHHFRHASLSWGEERLRAARRSLALFPGLPLAHWLAASVLVARQVLDEAERELIAGAAAQDSQTANTPFSGIALHWLLGLVSLARGDEPRAMAEFERELAFEGQGHLYSRECCANTWYAIGAVHLRRGDRQEARVAFGETLRRVASHPMALTALAVADGVTLPTQRPEYPVPGPNPIEVALCEAVRLALVGRAGDAAATLDAALAAGPAGSAAWLLPVEPILDVGANQAIWTPALTRLRARAA